nr:MAG TPA: hypothetical protein [Caudoviricetes sp.]DAY95217.1 MAG TPA: hypothetical protein [Caudoviricetes sp.]
MTRLTYSKATDNLKLADGGAIPKLKTAVCPWNNPSEIVITADIKI